MHASNLGKNATARAFGDTETVQVLALDGGGLRGLYAASVVKSLEAQLGQPITKHFDIVTGTSTGGLIALALARGISGADIQRFYIENGRKIFPASGVLGRLRAVRSLVMSKYSNRVLKATLQSLLQDAVGNQPTLGDSQCRLVIPTFRSGESTPRLLKTPHADRYKYDWKLPMWAVGMATSAAPTYLPSFEFDGKTYVDGGLWANNPSLVGLVEAKDLGAQLSNIRILNIGTTYSTSETVFQHWLARLIRIRRAGFLGWAAQILPTVMQANSYATSSMYVHQLLDKGNSYVINKQLDQRSSKLDRIDNRVFAEMGEAAGETHFSHLGRFFDHTAKPYTPAKEAMNGRS